MNVRPKTFFFEEALIYEVTQQMFWWRERSLWGPGRVLFLCVCVCVCVCVAILRFWIWSRTRIPPSCQKCWALTMTSRGIIKRASLIIFCYYVLFHFVLFSFVFFCFLLLYLVLFYLVLFSFVLFSFVFFCFLFFCNVLFSFAPFCLWLIVAFSSTNQDWNSY